MNHAVCASLLVLASSYAAIAASPAPIAWWTFAPSEDAPDLIEDISGHGFDAVILDPSSVSRTGSAPGGAALSFSPGQAPDGARELVAAHLPEHSPETPFTLSAWVRADGIGGVAPFLSRTSDADGWSDGFVLFLDTDGVPGIAVGPGADHAALADVDHAFHPGEWHHVALVSDGGTTTTLFLDGVDVVSVPSVPVPVDVPLVFGPVSASIGHSFVGAMADVRFFDASLSPGQIAELVSESRRDVEFPAFTRAAENEMTSPSSSLAANKNIEDGPPSSASSPGSQASATPEPIRLSAPILRVWTRME